MNDDERRLHDWFDEELDRMAISGDRPVDPRRVFASETDRSLSETAAELRRLDTAQNTEPSAGFLNSLERTLMNSSKTQSAQGAPRTRRSVSDAGSAPTQLQYARSSGPWFYTTLALVLLMTLGTIGITRWAGSGTPAEPTATSGFAAQTSDSTPDAGITVAFVSDELPAVESLAPGENATITWQLGIPEGARGYSLGGTILTNGMVYRQLTIEGDDEGDGYAIDEDGNRELVHEGIRFNGIQALDAATGESVWKYYLGYGRAGFEADVFAVYSVTSPNEIIALGANDGEERWTSRLNGSIVSMNLRAGTLYVWDTHYTLTAIDARTGDTLWSNSIEGGEGWQLGPNGTPVRGSGIVVGSSTIAAVSADSRLLVFDRAGGAILWEESGFDVLRTSLTSTDDVLVVTTRSGASTEQNPATESTVTAYDFTSGDVLWSTTGDRLEGRVVAVAGSNTFVLTGDELVIDSSGDASTPLVDFEVDGSNALWTADGLEPVWAGADEGGVHDFIFGIDARTGQIVWQRSAIASGFWSVYAAPGNVTQVLALTNDNQIVLLDGATGQVLAEAFTLDRSIPISGLVVGSATEGIFLIVRGKSFYSLWQSPAA